MHAMKWKKVNFSHCFWFVFISFYLLKYLLSVIWMIFSSVIWPTPWKVSNPRLFWRPSLKGFSKNSLQAYPGTASCASINRLSQSSRLGRQNCVRERASPKNCLLQELTTEIVNWYVLSVKKIKGKFCWWKI